ncbi:MAG: type I toxin-antitoxin system SymE family toxin [Ignavibacteriae bacterium]|nr:type I toxin-antitoxin system SymE family toxin [Ignavibacteriota bacterium]
MITLDVDALEKNGKYKRLRKVYYGHYDREFGPPHPMIRLRGRYLETYGFKVGDRINVRLDEGCIIITKVSELTANDKA